MFSLMGRCAVCRKLNQQKILGSNTLFTCVLKASFMLDDMPRMRSLSGLEEFTVQLRDHRCDSGNPVFAYILIPIFHRDETVCAA